MNLVRHVLLACLFLAGPGQLAATPAPSRDWSQVAMRTPDGTFVQGNPHARVKLVEYLSLTCPHCAHFEAEGITPLTAKYIRTGLVSYEVRHALRDAFDLAGSLIARCDGPQAFFVTLPRVYAQQNVWFARAEAWSRIEQADGLPPAQLLPKVAAGAGFDKVFGMSTARIATCLANQDDQAQLTAMAGGAWRLPGFPGTPAFQIDGKLQTEVLTWPELDAKLAAALNMQSLPRKTKRP